MSAPDRHPQPELLFDHARGVLEPGRALVIETHLGVCPACRATVRAAEAVGGVLLEDLEPAAMAPDALTHALARLDTPQPPSPPAAAKQPPDWIRVPPEVLIAAERRKRWRAPGVWVAPVTHDRKTGKRSYLLGVGRNIAVPMHSHRGVELICVLKGAYTDRGDIHGPGDFACNDEDVEHQPRVTTDGECVCLIAADSALVPRSLIAHLLQPIVNI